jgi:hypothetical protein
MLADRPMPTAFEVQGILTSLLGKPVRARACKPVDPATLDKGVVALFTSGARSCAFVTIFDLPLACSLGAALMLIPGDTARESAKSGTIPENILDNVREVFNVCSRFFSAKDAPRCYLESCHIPGTEIPESALKMVREAPTRLCFQLELTGYPGGVATILAR